MTTSTTTCDYCQSEISKAPVYHWSGYIPGIPGKTDLCEYCYQKYLTSVEDWWSYRKQPDEKVNL